MLPFLSNYDIEFIVLATNGNTIGPKKIPNKKNQACLQVLQGLSPLIFFDLEKASFYTCEKSREANTGKYLKHAGQSTLSTTVRKHCSSVEGLINHNWGPEKKSSLKM